MARVAVVGSGFIGRAWAITFARAGHDVALWDENPEAPHRAIDFIASVTPDLAANDLLGGASPEALLARLRAEKTLAAALADADHVQENAPERLDVKKAIFSELDRLAPQSAVLGQFQFSNSAVTFHGASGASASLPRHSSDQSALSDPGCGSGARTVDSAETVERARAFLVAAGQAPIVMKRELDGFVMNRMQGALLEEAFRLVADGFASVEDVDVGIREGLALRWSFMGPFETIDLNAPAGVRDYVERYQGIYANLFEQMQRRVDWAGPVLAQIEGERRAKLPANQLVERQKWRDRRLMALAAQKRRAARDIGT